MNNFGERRAQVCNDHQIREHLIESKRKINRIKYLENMENPQKVENDDSGPKEIAQKNLEKPAVDSKKDQPKK